MKENKVLILLFLLFPTFIFSQTAENMFVLKGEQKEYYKLKPYIFIYNDPSKELTIDQIITRYQKNEFIKLDTISKKLNSKNTYWGRFEITSLLENDTYWFVNFGNSILRLDYLDSYIFDKNGKQLQHNKFGFSNPASEITNPKHRGRFELLLNSHDTLVIYLKIRIESNRTPTFDVKLTDKVYLTQKNNRKNLIKLFYEGILWIFIIYNFLTFFISRDRIYLYYALYFFGAALYTLYTNKYLMFSILAESPKLEAVFWLLSIGPGTIFYFMFMRLFVNTKKVLSSKWNLVINIYIFTKIGIIIIEFLLLAFTYNIPFISAITIYVNIVEFILAVVFMVRLSLLKDKLAYYFVAGSLFLWVGFVVASIMFMLGNPNSSYIGEIGLVGELLIFALGLGYRIRKNEKDKQVAQQTLIKQLKHNDELKTKVNRELDQKVKEKTEDVLMKNEILNQQKEEILSQVEELERQKEIENIQKQKITDSIVYAQRIQQAILPSEEEMKQIFNDFFVLYMPRDIVSGDFLWAKQIGNLKIIAVADCTGHGVPGAFVSMLGMALLNELIHKNSELQTNLILDKMREHLKNSFNQHGKAGETKDGLDIGLVIIDTKTKKIQFSGAYIPLFIRRTKNIESNETELICIKGDRLPIAVYIKERPFTKKEILIQKNDCIYLTSDGYYDQIGETNSKFLIKRYKDLLLSQQNISLKEQKQNFHQTHKKWKGNRNQIDDILVVGINVDDF